MISPATAREIVAALSGDSNDDEHDALVSVAQELGLEWTPFEEREPATLTIEVDDGNTLPAAARRVADLIEQGYARGNDPDWSVTP